MYDVFFALSRLSTVCLSRMPRSINIQLKSDEFGLSYWHGIAFLGGSRNLGGREGEGAAWICEYGGKPS